MKVTTLRHRLNNNTNNKKDHRPMSFILRMKKTLFLPRHYLRLDKDRWHRVPMVSLHSLSTHSHTLFFHIPSHTRHLGRLGIVLGMGLDGSFRPVSAAIAEQVISSMSAAGVAAAGGGSHRTNANAQRRNAISGPPSGNPPLTRSNHTYHLDMLF